MTRDGNRYPFQLELDSTDPGRVLDAVRSLGESGDLEAVPPLLHLLKTTQEHRIRDAAAVALRDLGDSRAIGPLVELISDPRTDRHRGTLLYALEGFNCLEFIPNLVELVITGGFEVSRQALLVIENVEGEVAPIVLSQCIKRIEDAMAIASEDKRPLLEELWDMFSSTDSSLE